MPSLVGSEMCIRDRCKGECLKVHSHDTQYSPQQTSSATSLFLAPITNVIDSITYLRAAAVFWTLCNNASLLISFFDNDCDVAYMLDLLSIFESVDKTTYKKMRTLFVAPR